MPDFFNADNHTSTVVVKDDNGNEVVIPKETKTETETKEPVTKTDVKTETQTTEKKPDIEIDVKGKQAETKVDEKKDVKPVDEKPTTETKEVGEAQTKNVSGEETQPDIKININEQPKGKEGTLNLNDDVVLNYLKDKGLQVDSFDELKQELPEDVQKFLQFKKETGGSYIDFLNVNKDWSKASKEEVLKEYYKKRFPTFSDEDILDQIELLKVDESLKDELTENEYRKRKFEFNKTYAEALSFLNENSQKYKTDLTQRFSKEQKPNQIDEQKLLEYQKLYVEQREKSLAELNEINIAVGDIGNIVVPIRDEYKDMVRKYTETDQDFFKLWQTENGFDTKRMARDFQWAIPEVRNRLLTEIISQAIMLNKVKESQENRNVDLTDTKQPNEQPLGDVKVHRQSGADDNFFKPI